MPAPRTNSETVAKVYFSIREVALILDVSVSTVRAWGREIDLHTRRDSHNRRRFNVKEVNRLEGLRRLKKER